MHSSNLRPKWWQLYLTFPLLIVLFVLDARLKISTRGHQAVQIAIVLLVFGLIHLWLRANATALSNIDQKEYGRITVIRIPADPLPDSRAEEQTIPKFPASEIKGVLSDTFEMDYIDVDSFPLDEVSQELKKE
jgi:hypothetical protein